MGEDNTHAASALHVAECVICLDDADANRTWAVLQKCGHIFHKDCLDRALGMPNRCCPACRVRNAQNAIQITFLTLSMKATLPSACMQMKVGSSEVPLKIFGIRTLPKQVNELAELHRTNEAKARLQVRLTGERRHECMKHAVMKRVSAFASNGHRCILSGART
jgi:hypothetical protein